MFVMSYKHRCSQPEFFPHVLFLDMSFFLFFSWINFWLLSCAALSYACWCEESPVFCTAHALMIIPCMLRMPIPRPLKLINIITCDFWSCTIATYKLQKKNGVAKSEAHYSDCLLCWQFIIMLLYQLNSKLMR